MKKFTRIILTGLIAFSLSFMVGYSQNAWPKSIATDNGGKIVIYQPQPENLNGDILAARAAVSIVTSTGTEPTFGSIWFDANLQTDIDNHSAMLRSLTIKDAKFPGLKDQQQLQFFTNAIQVDAPTWNVEFSKEQLTTAIEQTKQLSQPNLKNDAPKIIYKDRASTLIIIDGQPKVQLDKKTGFKRVINTPSTIVLNPNDNHYYFYGGGLWYSSNNILSGWNFTPNVPSNIQQLDVQIQAAQKKDATTKTENKQVTPTEIIVSTEPAELIQTDGSASYQTVQGTNLLYVDNSLNDIFKDINSQKNYILLSGRWYTSRLLSGPWTYVPADQLPQDFAQIPEGSEKDGVLSSVAGTDAANEALMDAQIPQTAKIDRQTATTHVTYDGAPVFKRIQGTNLSVAENSNETVIKSNANGNYYAVDNGVWFISNSPSGPWQVSTERPSDVDNIPADNIAYNVKYVYVYYYTPDYVYSGYTPGYLGCYTYGPTVVWGTGWYYDAWYRQVYYARPYTWGFGMVYNPWSGWSIGYESGYSLGGGYYEYNPYGRGWFGPRVYHPSCREWGYNGGYYGRNRNVVINQPRITVNRPVYISRNNNYNPRDLYIGRSHTSNLYTHVRGAVTVDVNRRDAVILEHKQYIGRPINNNNNGNNWGGGRGFNRGQPQISNNNGGNNNHVVTPNPSHSSEVIGRPRNNNNENNHIRPISTPNVHYTTPNNSPTQPTNNGGSAPINRPYVQPAVPSNNTLSQPTNSGGNTTINRPYVQPSAPQNNNTPQRPTTNIGRPMAPRQEPVEIRNPQQGGRGDAGGSNNNRPLPQVTPQRPQPTNTPPVREQTRPLRKEN